MITLIVGGVAVLAVIAAVVGLVDAATAPAWRRIAAERRRQWEERQARLPEYHGVAHDSHDAHDDWDDD